MSSPETIRLLRESFHAAAVRHATGHLDHLTGSRSRCLDPDQLQRVANWRLSQANRAQEYNVAFTDSSAEELVIWSASGETLAEFERLATLAWKRLGGDDVPCPAMLPADSSRIGFGPVAKWVMRLGELFGWARAKIEEPFARRTSTFPPALFFEEIACVQRQADHSLFDASIQAIDRLAVCAEKSRVAPGSQERRTRRPTTKPAHCKNADRDKWVARQRERKNPVPWDEIYDDVVRMAARRGWDYPGSSKALSQALYRNKKKRPR